MDIQENISSCRDEFYKILDLIVKEENPQKRQEYAQYISELYNGITSFLSEQIQATKPVIHADDIDSPSALPRNAIK